MSNLPPGLYDRVVDGELAAVIAALPPALRAELASVDKAELPARIADVVARWISYSLEKAPSTLREAAAVELLGRIGSLLRNDNTHPLPEPIKALRSVSRVDPTGAPLTPPRPASPIGDTFLLTNSRSEPSVGHELHSEIESADRIDLIVAFIRWSGIRMLIDPLRKHVEAGKPLRIITTCYTGSTELKALERLQDIGADIRVSYDTSSTRLHAKAWLFHRESGFSTAYVGSSNLTFSAQASGVEWNIRASEVSSRPIVEKFRTVFETYWADRTYEAFNSEIFRERNAQANASFPDGPLVHLVAIRPFPFQSLMLEQLELERERGHSRNLVVAATGTGKTVVAALDYKRLRETSETSETSDPGDRLNSLLFIAHRKEILSQSRAMFRHALSNGSFGELWVDGHKPEEWKHVFASIQSISANDVEKIDPDHFDVVIIDEFHRAGAPTYRAVLDHLRPRQLLGLTATPERSDGENVFDYFDGRIAVELRLWDALEQGLLVPFHYFGVHDGTNLSKLPWKRGYAPADLERIYTADDVWFGMVWKAMDNYLGEVRSIRALGFCASVGHAHFMAKKFNEQGLSAVALDGSSPGAVRQNALEDLRDGKVNIICAVDLFNEGLDIPAIDTVLMLRPTESATIFLQQLGRGLRRTTDKSVLTVLDFVGNQHANFRFEQRFRKLLGRSRTELIDDIRQNFPYLPAGTHIQLDRESQKIVIDNIKNSLPTSWRQRVDELRALAVTNSDIGLADYLKDTGLELTDVYAGSPRHSWSELKMDAGLASLPADQAEFLPKPARGISRLIHVDDPVRLDAWQRLLSMEQPPAAASLTERDRRLLHMLLLELLYPSKGEYANLDAAAAVLWRNYLLRHELLELVPLLDNLRQHKVRDTGIGEPVPLQTHATYSRNEVMAAIGARSVTHPAKVREGVYHAKDLDLDVFFVTLQKTEKDFSPLTRYRDYAISDELFHWESQHATSIDSPTGQRYVGQRERGTKVLLFVREKKSTPDGRTSPFFNCGLVDHVQHAGTNPIQITWRLRDPLPGDMFASFRAAVA